MELDAAASAHRPPVQRGLANHDTILLVVIAIVAAGAWLAGETRLYDPDSDLAYNLGLAGGISMLLLLLYPLRKRLRLLRAALPLRYWFSAHMALGIVGPLLIMYHSNYRLESINGAVAFYSMLAVFLSGLLGRFIYRRIHYGLYGQKASLDELKQRLGMNGADMHSRLKHLPNVESALARFEEDALNRGGGAIAQLLYQLQFVFASFRLRRAAIREIRHTINAHAAQKSWSRGERKRRVALGTMIVDRYLDSIKRVVQFRLYERLFSYWHVLHVPLLFLLIATAAIHVLAVHMY